VSVQRIGNTSLIRGEDAAAFLAEAARHGIGVIGAEGFHRDGTGVVPTLDAILDLSGPDDPARSVDEAKSFVDAVSEPGLLIEFVLGNRGTAP
jgi:hypothetical protein